MKKSSSLLQFTFYVHMPYLLRRGERFHSKKHDIARSTAKRDASGASREAASLDGPVKSISGVTVKSRFPRDRAF
jgi:hypothetical protein